MNEHSPAVSLGDVARAAGVGKATASRALSERSNLDISAATRSHVRAVAERLGYSPNRAARSLRTGRHQAFGLVAPIADWAWWAPVVDGAASAAAAAGYHLVVTPADHSTAMPAVLAELGDLAVDGAIVMTDQPVDAPPSVAADFALVMIDDITSTPAVATVRGDNEAGGYALGRHLRDKGRRAPVIVHGDPTAAYVAERIAGFRRAFAEDGIDVARDRLILTDETMDPATADPARLARELSDRTPCDAVFATADYLAATALRALRLRGLRVPDDVAVVGYDDERIAAVLDPPLTTYHQPLREMGAAAVRALLAQLSGESAVDTEVLPGALVVRESS